MRWVQFHHPIHILDVLIRNGANINESDSEGTVILHLIHQVKHITNTQVYLDTIKKVLEYGANPSIKKGSLSNHNCFDIIASYRAWREERIDSPQYPGHVSYRHVPNETNPVTLDRINKVEELLKNASSIRENFLEEQKQRTLQKNWAKLLLQPINYADIAITISSKNTLLHSAILSVRCPLLSRHPF